ncbi:MAG: NfeD family protein [Oscillospiraceae bacterium]|nr:NfeD family protein [Oscillospiraceae bacterium]
MPYIWIGIIVFASILELYTRAAAAFWFIPAALVSFILSLTGTVDVWTQVLVFFIIALILLILSRTIFKKFIKFKAVSTNYNSVIGKTAIVTEEINNFKNTGAVRINGATWTAKSEDDDIIYESGLVVSIVGTDGVKAICSR